MHHVMEFILPVLSASGEAVIMVLVLVALFIVGRGRMQPLAKTLVIERPGQYTMVLAPGLNLAQPFIEAIAKQVAQSERREGEAQLHFEVRDKEVAAAYHLTISVAAGMLRFEARNAPWDATAASAQSGGELEKEIENAARTIAGSWGIGLLKIGKASAAVGA